MKIDKGKTQTQERFKDFANNYFFLPYPGHLPHLILQKKIALIIDQALSNIKKCVEVNEPLPGLEPRVLGLLA